VDFAQDALLKKLMINLLSSPSAEFIGGTLNSFRWQGGPKSFIPIGPGRIANPAACR
jgi:hypothetical protein